MGSSLGPETALSKTQSGTKLGAVRQTWLTLLVDRFRPMLRMSRFNFTNTSIRGLKLVGRRRLRISGGFLSARDREMDSVLGSRSVVQINRTFTARRAPLLGLYFQHPPNEMKIVNCLKGEIFDVVVDFAKAHRFFNSYSEIECARRQHASSTRRLAHGFQALTRLRVDVPAYGALCIRRRRP